MPRQRTVNISMPESMKRYVDRSVARHDFGNVSEFFRHLVREERRREAAREEIDRLLAQGLDSGPGSSLDEAYFARLARGVARRAPRARGRGAA